MSQELPPASLADLVTQVSRNDSSEIITASAVYAAGEGVVPSHHHHRHRQDYSSPNNARASSERQNRISVGKKKRGLVSMCGCFRPRVQAADDSITSSNSNAQQRDSARISVRSPKAVLGPQKESDRGKKTLVLDLDETLVHSSFRPVSKASFIIPVKIEGHVHEIFVLKRPGVDEFLTYVAKFYEIVIYTASLAKYADPLLDRLDTKRLCSWRLFREACTFCNGSYVKDLSKIGRDLSRVIIIDNSPLAYSLQPDNAIPIKSWFEDETDRELIDLIPILEALSLVEEAIPTVLKQALMSVDDDNSAAPRS